MVHVKSLFVVLVVMLVCLPLSAVFAAPSDEAVKKELKALVGEWSPKSGTDGDGNDVPTSLLPTYTITADGKCNITNSQNDNTIACKVTLDLAASPRRLTIRDEDGTKWQYLYELKGNRLKLVQSPKVGKFPANFSEKGASTSIYGK